ncbi:MAG: PAAR domain-containing protein [Polyangiaceae bacterium]
MPDVSTRVDLCKGHDACSPRPFAEHSPNVFAETFEVTREGDAFQDHGCPDHVPHSAVVTQGWQSVLVNQKPITVVGSSVSCPSGEVGTGRPTVLVGEGWRLR